MAIQKQIQIQTQIPITKQTSIQRQISLTRQIALQKQISITQTISTMPTRVSLRFEPVVPLPTPTPTLIPRPFLFIPKLDLGKKAIKLKKPRREYKYTPSIAAVALNIKGAKPRVLTGLSIRPILRM